MQCAGGRGPRRATLRRRCSDWAPCRRYLLGTFGVPFPTEAAQVLDYFDTRAAGQAARTTYDSALLALGFFSAKRATSPRSLLLQIRNTKWRQKYLGLF